MRPIPVQDPTTPNRRRAILWPTLCLTVLLCASAQGAAIVNANSTGAYVGEGGSSYDDHLDGTLAYVMWTADTVDPVEYHNPGDGLRTGDSVILDSLYLDENGMITDHDSVDYAWDDAGYQRWDTPGDFSFDSESQFLAGSVYLTVFDAAAPTVGDHYVSGTAAGIGTVADLEDQPLLPPDLGFGVMLDMTSSADAEDWLVATGDIIPEPAGVLVLLAASACVLWPRRRRG